MYESMFYIGMFFGLLNFGISIILFVKKRVASIIRDMMGWRKKPVIIREYKKQEMTDVLVKREVCMEQFFQVEEDIIVTHTEQKM